MTLTSTTYQDYMYERWERHKTIQQALYAKCPLLGLVRKPEDLGGTHVHVPMLQTGSQGRSRNHVTAVANATGSVVKGFDVTWESNYHVCLISGNVVDDTKGDKNAIIRALDHEMETGLKNIAKDIKQQIYGNIGGSRGQVGSISTTTLTLKNAEDSIHFEVGMEICASDDDGTGSGHALLDSGNAATITAIDRDAGTLETDSNWTTQISGLDADDYLFVEGDFNAGGGRWAGVDSWIPGTAPTSGDSFYTVDRSADVIRLAGIRYNGAGMPIENAFQNAIGEAALHGSEPNVIMCNPVRWQELAISLGSDLTGRLTRIQAKGTKADIGYDAIKVVSPEGMLPVVSDGGCPINVAYALNLSTWAVQSVGKLIRVIDDDGLKIRRASSGDNWQVDLKTRANVTCNSPGDNVRIALA